MKRLLPLVLGLLLSLLPAMAAALIQEELDSQVDTYFKQSQTVGGALVITQGDRIIYERYYGKQDSTQKTPVTENTYFRVASVTKMVSGIGFMQLKEQGLLELDTDISEYLGYAIANTYYPDTPITLRQLMSHTSSLRGALPGATKTVYSTLAKEERKHAYFLETEPGTAYTYSNFGAGVAGAILEAVTGVSVNRYMHDHVFAPLSIDAAYSPSLLTESEYIATLYKSDLTRYRKVETLLAETYEDFADPQNHFRTTIGSLWIRAKDLAKLTIALCGDGCVDGVRLLTMESLSQMRDDQASYQRSVTGESPYGLFLQREQTLLDGHTFYGHQGMFEGVLCNVYFEPETGFGFVMLTNGCDNVMDNRIGVLTRRMFELMYDSFTNGDITDPFLVL